MGHVAIVLAAGRGSRFGGDKLACRIDGRSLLDHAIDKALAAPVERAIVVTRPERELPGKPGIERVDVTGEALSDSLRAGLAAAGDAEGAFVFLGDMPLVPEDLAGRLGKAIGSAIAAVPMVDGAPGHPVLLARRGFALAAGLTGDHGLGSVLRGRDDVVRLAVDEAGAALDIDTPADLAAAQARGAGRTAP